MVKKANVRESKFFGISSGRGEALVSYKTAQPSLPLDLNCAHNST